MSDRYDVAARLAEGRPAVEHTQTYVQACHAVGYQQPDLTARASQVWDWYDTETGLDLRVLDGDAAALGAAVTAIEEALWVQRAQLTELAAAWRGRGADSAMRFLQRHCDAAAEAVVHVRAAAERYATLRDDVWQAVDGKVATAIAIDERAAAQRSAWLAAAHTVTTGAGNRPTAEEVVSQQISPYVDNDIRIDWLAAMGSSTASVAASYDAAIHVVTSGAEVCFDVPGDLGPSWQPVVDEPPRFSPAAETALPAAVPTVPAAAPAVRPPTSEEPQPLSTTGLDDTASPLPELGAPLGDAAGLPTGAGNFGGLGGIAGGIGGVVGSIVDGIGSILGSLAGGLDDGSDSGDSLADDPLVDQADKADDPDGTDDTGDKAEPVSLDDTAPEEPADPLSETPPTTGDAVGEPVAQQVNPPPPDASPPAAAVPPDDEATPCEIAEDQLPQAGQ
ncbi:MAG TPA: hypothetical protein VGG53_09105 [Mycobacterium sp.]|uniref:hypothetical protein n=1 Tax=Mycobacterium sp. TaxID=1785 RepID=UPI002F404C02